jgi:DNA-binding SARP family transcriptional activator
VLKTIIAGGGSNVADTYVADLLWPDSDGDLAMQSLATTLHRLRKLLGRQEAVTLQNGILSLDPSMCWIDARAFEHLLSRAEDLWEEACTEEDFERACAPIFSALELYKGEFLPDDEVIPDVIAMRAYLHARFLKAVYRLGECLIRTGLYDKARQAIERGLDVDTCAEELYRLLMTCLGSQGRKTDALVVFERCKKTLQAELGAAPSADTEALARDLRADKTH